MITRFLRSCYQSWAYAKDGVAATEAALVFPILAVLLLGTYDYGNAVVVNNKVIRASQVTADLITRDRSVDTTMINEAIRAGELSLQPYGVASYGVDIVSVRFNEDSEAIIEWRETRNMTASSDILDTVEPLAEPNNGVVIVTIQYQYDPLFAGFSMGSLSFDTMSMQERAFARGRRTAVVSRI